MHLICSYTSSSFFPLHWPESSCHHFLFWMNPMLSWWTDIYPTEGARRASTMSEPASAICQTTAWRMTGASSCPGCRPTSCASWGLAFTLPEYRRAGHLLALSLDLMRRMSAMGLPVYCHVNQLNRATVKAVSALGFSPGPGMENTSVLLICRDRVWAS